MISKYLKNLSIVLIIFLIDRISKIYVIYLNSKFYGSEIFSSEFLNISLVWNEGIAFGILSFKSQLLYNILTLFIFSIIFFLILITIRSEGFRKYSLLMILGGAFGNVFDRVFNKAVPDFIDLHYNNFHWFIFNVADIFITIGILSMIFLELINKNSKEKL